jgi:hypothetical protein
MVESPSSSPPSGTPGGEPHLRAGDHGQELRDELPADLNAVEYVGVYQFPGNERRRYPAALAILSGLAMVIGWLASRGREPVLVSPGVGVGGLLLVMAGLYGLVAAVPLRVREVDALASASRAVGFPVGHASAQMGWRGLLSRPTWRILLYSAENPPASRGLVLVDGFDGSVIHQFVEDNPEDWSGLPGAGTTDC